LRNKLDARLAIFRRADLLAKAFLDELKRSGRGNHGAIDDAFAQRDYHFRLSAHL